MDRMRHDCCENLENIDKLMPWREAGKRYRAALERLEGAVSEWLTKPSSQSKAELVAAFGSVQAARKEQERQIADDTQND